MSKIEIPASKPTDGLDVQKDSLPSPESMEPRTRQLEIMALQRRLLAGETLTSAELRRGLLLIRTDKNVRTGKKPGGTKGTAVKKPAAPQLSLNDF